MKKQKNQLYLVLSKEWFDEILAGTKKEEYRAFTDFYISRLCVLDEDREIVNFKPYETVKFQLGYAKDAPLL
ncbi:hypothetical protein EDM00_01755 [Ornithobacterium rhinotracheale]|uniref:hypothetical protein n=1 Tax=Ornithobacterium rhinotracheale TaxID=28251 RepID=UPI00129C5100|nr:hypothetical protein [Ornithobacterium rhinotracheale]MRI62726.1 hypothetical protein [Ornithobacterium rhinotracheale]